MTSDAGLELALRSKLADPVAKAALVDRLLGGKASAADRSDRAAARAAAAWTEHP